MNTTKLNLSQAMAAIALVKAAWPHQTIEKPTLKLWARSLVGYPACDVEQGIADAAKRERHASLAVITSAIRAARKRRWDAESRAQDARALLPGFAPVDYHRAAANAVVAIRTAFGVAASRAGDGSFVMRQGEAERLHRDLMAMIEEDLLRELVSAWEQYLALTGEKPKVTGERSLFAGKSLADLVDTARKARAAA